MADTKYKIIDKEEQDNSTDPEDNEDDDVYTEHFGNDNDNDDTVTIITSSNNEPHSIYPKNKFNDVDIMQTPAAILALILIYFAFSIGLTFYQRNLLEVRLRNIRIDFFFLLQSNTLWLLPLTRPCNQAYYAFCGMC